MHSAIPISFIFFSPFFDNLPKIASDRSFHLLIRRSRGRTPYVPRDTRLDERAWPLSCVSSFTAFASLPSISALHHPLCLAPCSYLPLFVAAITPVEKMPYRGKLRLLGRACLAFGNACGKSESNPCFAVASIAGSRNFSVGRALDMR